MDMQTTTTSTNGDTIPLCFMLLEKVFPGDMAKLGCAWCYHRLDQRDDTGEDSEFAGFNEHVIEAAWYGSDAVVAEALRRICEAYPAIIARIPPTARWAFAEGWLTAWEDACGAVPR